MTKHACRLAYIHAPYLGLHSPKPAAYHTLMTSFAERLAHVRKQRRLSQADTGRLVGINGDAYGRYERGEVRPTVETARRIADALEVSLDYLTGKTDLVIDDTMLKRMEHIAAMTDEDQGHVFTLLDAFIARTKLRGLV